MNVQLAGEIVKVAAGAVTLATTLFGGLRWYGGRRTRSRLEARLGKQKYAVGDIDQYTKYYVEPDCQSLDPAGADEPRRTIAARQPVFSTLDESLSKDSQYRYIFVLADSGMGKSALLLNYYARHLRSKRRSQFQLRLFPANGFSRNDADSIQDQDQTVLFLDALDEDMAANDDLNARVQALLEMTKDFRKVLLTCRTQFFAKDAEIPNETGMMRVGPRAAGSPAQHYFHKLYLSPFSDQQISNYLRKRFRWFEKRSRRKAAQLVQKIPNLAVRPMLLAHIDSLIDTTEPLRYSWELYDRMVEAWLEREEGSAQGITRDALRTFSERLALDLYSNQQRGGSDRVPHDEISHLATKWVIPLKRWQLTGRSLLNRDAEGNYKFAHRSIMEYLVVKQAVSGAETAVPGPWTDQMHAFLDEMLRSGVVKLSRLSNVDLQGASLIGQSLRGAVLRGANLSRAKLREADLTGAALDKANLVHATLARANLSNCSLVQADLTDAILSDANLEGANLSGADLRRANLTGANLMGVVLPNGQLAHAVAVGARLAGAKLAGTKLTDADLTNADLTGADLERADLTGATLTNATLEEANLTWAILKGVKGLPAETAEQARLSGATLDTPAIARSRPTSDVSRRLGPAPTPAPRPPAFFAPKVVEAQPVDVGDKPLDVSDETLDDKRR